MAISTSRRRFLSASLAAGATLALGSTPRRAAAGITSPAASRAPLRILVLGGTAMLGPAVIDAALARGHRVTMFNRGKTEAQRGTPIPAAVERLVGDRDPRKGNGLAALKGREFDVVIDTSGLFPRHVACSADLLESQGTRRYIFISSISAYDNHRTPGADESDAPANPRNPYEEEGDAGFVYTGELKRPCEQAVERIFGAKATIIRPAYLVGPGDATGRFAYWPIRVREATGDHADMLVPGPPDMPIQVVDVRDLAAWLMLVAEQDIPGTFNACGPAAPLTITDVLHACEEAAGRTGDKAPRYEWVTWDFLRTQKLPMPIVLPPEGDTAGFHRRSGAKAIAAGLRFRPMRETAAAILAWWDQQPAEEKPRFRGRPTLEREQEALRAWKSR